MLIHSYKYLELHYREPMAFRKYTKQDIRCVSLFPLLEALYIV